MQVNSPPLKVVTGGQVIGNTAVQDLRPKAQPEASPGLADYIAWLQDRTFDKGIELELCEDFQELRAVVEAIPERHPIQPEFDPHLTDVGPGNALWVKGLDRCGEVVHLQAMRIYDLRGKTLDEHLGATINKLYCGPGAEAKLNESQASSAPAARSITGWVCYHGELWIRDGDGGFRGRGLSRFLPRFLLAVALKKWSPDFVYGFVDHAQVQKGLPARYGYMHMQPGAIRWDVPPKHIAPEEWLVWLDRDDLIYLTQRHP